ncbi:hypothetical protein MRX96_012270 [Rhipicephalus microplus]
MAASTKTGYDPSTMQWVDIEVAETREDEYLRIMVRQLQEKLAKMKPRGSTAAAQPQARKTGSTPAACVESPRQLATWRPTHTPRIRSDELVIVLKPKITMNLHAAFGPGGIGTAVQCFTGSTTNAGISVWRVWDKKIVVVAGHVLKIARDLLGTRPSKSDELFRKDDVMRLRDAAWSRKAQVVGSPYPRSYLVKTEDQKLLRRNRRHLLQTGERFIEEIDDGIDTSSADNNVGGHPTVATSTSPAKGRRREVPTSGDPSPPVVRLSDFKPVLDDVAVGNASRVSCQTSLRKRILESEAEEDVGRHRDDSALALRSVGLIESRLSDLERRLDAHTRHMDDQFDRIDGHLLRIHMQMTMMQHSFMRDTQAMLQQVFDEVVTLRAEIAELRDDA